MININSCEVCGNTTLTPVLDLGSHPICDELIPINSSLTNEEYSINIHYCEKCYTAHQTTQIPKLRLFPPTYHYRARFTADVLNGMKSLVQYLSDNFFDLNGKKVMDVGCNDGSLLDFFENKGAITYGVEPTDAAYDAQEKKHNVVRDYFTPELALLLDKVDIITFTNVFAHIEDLDSLLKAVKNISTPETILVVENHYLGGVLNKNQFDTFYHEHPRTYSLNSFIHIAKNLKLDILSVEFPSRYGGNIRVVIGDSKIHKTINSNIDKVLEEESKFIDKFKQMNEFINKWKIDKKAEILSYIEKYGKIKAKAFPARSAIPIKLLGLTHEHIECVCERPGSMKVGHYVPGTRIPIKDDTALDIQHEKGILNNAWHISTEIESYLKNWGFKGDLINII